MTEALELSGAERVLEVGTGSGYQAAILSRLADQIVSIERIAGLAAQARRALDDLQVNNVSIFVGDGTQGHAAEAPFELTGHSHQAEKQQHDNSDLDAFYAGRFAHVHEVIHQVAHQAVIVFNAHGSRRFENQGAMRRRITF